jgi:hypothetical protein
MKDQLAKALEADDARSDGSDRILKAAFFRRAPLQAGTQPSGGSISRLDERRAELAAARTRA